MKAENSVSAARITSLIGDLSTLVKARLSFLVLITSLVGFLMGWQGPMDYLVLAGTLVGTALAAAGAAALNQWMERGFDARMKRTKNRPLPAGRMHATDALMTGLLLAVSGIATLAVLANALSAFLAAVTVLTYVLVYTPLKRVTTLNTLIGAVPGALPPLLGWTAATGSIGVPGVLLFAILWFWQMPHFLAIAWMYKDDYRDAGFVMLSGKDLHGVLTGRQALIYTVYLVVVSTLPGLMGMVASWFTLAALLLGGAFAYLAWRFLKHPSNHSARMLFFGSILYLPLLLGVLLAARL